MIGFYVVRGHDHERLVNLSQVEKAVFIHWMNQHREEEEEKLRRLFGGK
jgi:hypothetical protein